MSRILLSVPHMGGAEERYVQEAFRSNWLSTVGPNIDAFEREFSALVGLPSVALASGTAALHLGLRLLGVGAGDEVFVQDLTFAASVNPILYLGARPVFIDSERESWNLDPRLVAEAIESRAARGRPLPKAVIAVHLYGQTADMDALGSVCARWNVPVLEDAAEALGATYRGKPAGTLGAVGVYSFNGNKIITTTGGGMLVAPSPEAVARVRHWSTQAREPRREYHHVEIGFNYRMSNVLAGIGRGQLEVLGERVAARRRIAFRYRDAFADLPGIQLMPQATWGLHTNWLSVFTIDEDAFGESRDALIERLDARDIESRPVWKPMHLQPVFAGCECVGGGTVSADLYARGICLPSSSSLAPEAQDRVIEAVRERARS